MYLLPCPNCQTDLTVTNGQAGDQLTCPSCEELVAVPKLGMLRQLPRSEASSDKTVHRENADMGVGSRIAFAVLGLIAVASFIVALYTGIQWAIREKPTTTEDHIARIEEAVAEAEPAMMIREFESMEKFDLDLSLPYGYKAKAEEKAEWGWSTVVAGGISLLAIIGALAAATTGRRVRPGEPGKA